jgi:hypothetical protein
VTEVVRLFGYEKLASDKQSRCMARKSRKNREESTPKEFWCQMFGMRGFMRDAGGVNCVIYEPESRNEIVQLCSLGFNLT